MKTFLIVDGHSWAYRGYYALKRAGLTAPDGTPTGMLVGAMNMLYKVQNNIRPDCVVIVFDSGGKTFRHELLADYKANRKPSPDDFRIQLPILKDLLAFSGYKIISREGVEADDVIASLAKRVHNEGYQAVILTSDKDLFQLLETGVKMLRPVERGVSGAEVYDPAAFQKEFHFMPSSMADYLAMVGDTVDNVKGIEGIGDVTATNLLKKYPNLEEIFGHIDELSSFQKNRLKACGLDKALWIRDNLFKLKDDIFDGDNNILDECENFQPELDKALEITERLGLSKISARLQKIINGEEIFEDVPQHEEINQESESTAQITVIKPVAPVCGIMTRDFKTELKADPEKFTNNPQVWDLKTAYYMLHPDKTGKNFPNILDSVKTQEDFESTAAKLEGEILSHDGLHDVMTKIDIPLIPVLNKMELHGVRLDSGKISDIQKELEDEILAVESKIIDATGVRINLNSSKQVSWLLFERLAFTPEKKTAGKTSYSTDSSVLEKLAKLPAGKVPALILEYRELMKMLSGFVVPLQKAADNDGIIHTTFEPAMTGTGRLSSHDPNLQNIPAYGNWAEKIKSALIPVDEKNIFVAADYSQIELRVLAYMSGEEKLIDAFKNHRDIHTETASWVFSTAPEMVTPELRRAAKMINFGLLYGMSSFGLAERLGVGRKEAADIMKRYFDALPGIQNFLDMSVKIAEMQGFSRTLAGRIRPVSEIPAWGQGLDRALINSPVQGTAADIARRAMIKFEEAMPGKLFLQVHDSLVCECSESEAGEVAEVLSAIMKESGNEIDNLEVQIKSGKTLF